MDKPLKVKINEEVEELLVAVGWLEPTSLVLLEKE